ncbi:IS1634 family transposase [Desulfoscipio sp. XC116]|uniref:IS1634 family transposase n=1 Tax=Desulfoscipio sp. XC116 TaxID=3144975 RepID=UPI00325ADB0A
MFFRKITSRSNGREYTYLKLIENYREGDKVKQRVVANLGSMDKLTPDKVSGLIAGLSKICGIDERQSNNLETKKILRYGEVLAIHKIWKLLGMEKVIEDIAAVGKDVAPLLPLLVELMAINQIIKPQHKQAISDWYKCLYMPLLSDVELSAHHFYRALDVVADCKEELERAIFKRLTSLMHINTDLAFCRLTTGMIEPAPREELNLTSYGMYMLGEPGEYQKVDFGLLVSRDGMPLGHRILRETSEDRELKEVVNYLKGSFGIDKCIFIGERNVINNPALEILVAHNYDYIIGSKFITKQYRELFTHEWCANRHEFQELAEDLWFKELRDGDTRYLLCSNPMVSEQMKALLSERLHDIENELKSIKKTVCDRRGTKNKSVFNRNLPVFKDSYCRKYFEWHYNESTMEFNYRRRDDLLDYDTDLVGAFLLETNNDFLRGQEILKAYTSLTLLGESLREIENFEPWPNLLYAELKVSANIFICVLAAMLEKTMEILIRQSGLSLDTRQALLLLEDIKVVINQLGDQEFKSMTNISQPQEAILNAIGLFKEQRTVI